MYIYSWRSIFDVFSFPFMSFNVLVRWCDTSLFFSPNLFCLLLGWCSSKTWRTYNETVSILSLLRTCRFSFSGMQPNLYKNAESFSSFVWNSHFSLLFIRNCCFAFFFIWDCMMLIIDVTYQIHIFTRFLKAQIQRLHCNDISNFHLLIEHITLD